MDFPQFPCSGLELFNSELNARRARVCSPLIDLYRSALQERFTHAAAERKSKTTDDVSWQRSGRGYTFHLLSLRCCRQQND